MHHSTYSKYSTVYCVHTTLQTEGQGTVYHIYDTCTLIIHVVTSTVQVHIHVQYYNAVHEPDVPCAACISQCDVLTI